MTESSLEDVRRQVSRPVSPSDAFAVSLLERLEELRSGAGLSAAEIEAEGGEELPLREAMSVICPDPDPLVPVDPGAVLGNVEPGTPPT